MNTTVLLSALVSLSISYAHMSMTSAYTYTLENVNGEILFSCRYYDNKGKLVELKKIAVEPIYMYQVREIAEKCGFANMKYREPTKWQKQARDLPMYSVDMGWLDEGAVKKRYLNLNYFPTGTDELKEIFLSLAKKYDQSNAPIIGYEKVPWGATIQEVKQLYPIIKEVDSVEEHKKWGIRTFEEMVNSDGLHSRVFSFFKNKLYNVYLSYEKDLYSTLIKELEPIYGKFNKEEYGFKYSENLSIYIAENFDMCTVIYYDPIVAKHIKKNVIIK